MWDEIAAEVAEEFPDVTWDRMLVEQGAQQIFRRTQAAVDPLDQLGLLRFRILLVFPQNRNEQPRGVHRLQQIMAGGRQEPCFALVRFYR